nr:hypothetical protein [Campylobacterota bacterium]
VNYPYFKTKFWFFMMIFILMTVELGVDFAYFSQISLKQPVSCCSTIFGISGSNVLPFGLNITTLLILFYLLYLLSIILSFQKSALLLALSSGLFLVIAYLAVNHFFGTYIYQLPTHICPFCMLQSEYYYIGYLLWPLLFLSTFFGVANLLLKLLLKTELNNLYRLSRIFNTSFVILCSTYPLMYYFKNGVWL